MKVNEELNNILVAAYAEAQSREHEYLTPEHILFASLFFEEAKLIIRRCGGNVDDLKNKIEAFFKSKIPQRVENKEPIHSLSFQNVMSRAVYHTVSAQKAELDIGDVLIAIFDEKDSHAAFILQGEGLTRLNLLNYISHGIAVTPEERPPSHHAEEGERKPVVKEKKALAQFTTELVAKARAGASG